MATDAEGPAARVVSAEDAGYRKVLKPRQMQMLAIGGAIGTGLFLATGGRLNAVGPSLFLLYGLIGGFVFLILRALGELVLHRPTSGSFVSYGQEFFGAKFAYTVGWMYFYSWSLVAIVEITAVAEYLRYWHAFERVPQWLLALAALVLVLGMNLISVKVFGELEFWAALVKVVALALFLVIGTVYVLAGISVRGQTPGLGVVADHAGWFPTGLLPMVVVTTGVISAYAGVELIGTTAGETENPAKVMPRAINSVISRIVLFYVGSLVLFGLLLPYTEYRAQESPFVTFFSRIGVGGAGGAMNFVVLTAALSSLNAGLYSTGRILRSMAVTGIAPAFASRLFRNGVPYVGIVLCGLIALCGVVLNAVVPAKAFEIVLNMTSLGFLMAWATILLCQLRLWLRRRRGAAQQPAFRMPGAPYTGVVTLLFLVAVLVLMAVGEDEIQRWAVWSFVAVVPVLVAGWYLVRRRVTTHG